MAETKPDPTPAPILNPGFFASLKSFFSSEEAHAAFVATIMGAISVWGMPGTMKEKSPYFADYIWGVFGVWGAVIASRGYQKGKALEGTIPAGREPAQQTGQTTNVNMGGPSTAVVSTEKTTAPAVSPLDTSAAGLDDETRARLAALAAGKSWRKG